MTASGQGSTSGGASGSRGGAQGFGSSNAAAGGGGGGGGHVDWQPHPPVPRQEAPQARWYAQMREAFDADVICQKPQLTCGDCAHAQSRVCNRHKGAWCETCQRTMTEQHIHLDYVGHADTTSRLLEVDPEWRWRPAYRDVPQDLLMAAIATGNQQIVNAVIGNAPPLRDRDGGMWIVLTVHDDFGHEVEMLGYGDAQGKSGPNAVKELIGDALRNASMRRGLALDLWSRSERAELAKVGGDEGARGKRGRRNGSKPPEDQKSRPEIMAEVQALADLAKRIGDGDWDKRTEAELQTAVYEEAKKHRGWLNSIVVSPYDGEHRQLWAVIRQAKADIQAAVGMQATIQRGKAAADRAEAMRADDEARQGRQGADG